MSNLLSSVTDISNVLKNSAKENEELLQTYNDEIKPKLKTVVNQHSVAGAIIGPLPTMGIATTINLITLYCRLSKALDIPIMQELDKPGRDPRQDYEVFEFDKSVTSINDLKEGMVLPGILLAAIKVGVTGLDVSGVGLPIGIIAGAICGWYFSNKAGNIFANQIANFIADRTRT